MLFYVHFPCSFYLRFRCQDRICNFLSVEALFSKMAFKIILSRKTVDVEARTQVFGESVWRVGSPRVNAISVTLKLCAKLFSLPTSKCEQICWQKNEKESFGDQFCQIRIFKKRCVGSHCLECYVLPSHFKVDPLMVWICTSD
jgi:hypothetical protein